MRDFSQSLSPLGNVEKEKGDRAHRRRWKWLKWPHDRQRSLFVWLCPLHYQCRKGKWVAANQKLMMVVFWPNDEWWFVKVDSSERGVPCSSEPGGGGDESVLAQFSEQVVAMSRSALKSSSSSDGLTLSSSTTTTCFSTLARTVIPSSTPRNRWSRPSTTPTTRSRRTTRTWSAACPRSSTRRWPTGARRSCPRRALTVDQQEVEEEMTDTCPLSSARSWTSGRGWRAPSTWTTRPQALVQVRLY